MQIEIIACMCKLQCWLTVYTDLSQVNSITDTNDSCSAIINDSFMIITNGRRFSNGNDSSDIIL